MLNSSFTKKKLLVLFIFFILIAIIYGQSLWGDFVFDDRGITEYHDLLTDIDNINEVTLHPYWEAEAGLYRPTTLFSYSGNLIIFGNSPFSFHLINIVLYLFICFFIYLLIKKLFSDSLLAFISSLLFLILPIHTEVVANITGRSELLCLFFGLLAMLEFSKEKINFYLLFLWTLLAIGSKETGIVILPIIAILLYRKENKINLEIIKKYFKEISAVGIGILFYFFLRFFSLGINSFLHIKTSLIENPLLFTDPISRIATSLKILWMYFYKSFWPINLCSDYSYNQIPIIHNFFNLEVILGLLIIGLSIFLLFKYLNTENTLSLGAGIFIFSFLPISNIFFTIGTIAGERLFFFPSLGVVLIISFFICKILEANKKDLLRIILFVCLILISLSYVIISLNRQKVWLTEEDLFTSGVMCAPRSVLSLSHYGAMFLLKGDLDNAEKELTASMKEKPIYSKGINNLGLVYYKKGQYAKAKEMYYLALKQDFPYSGTLENLILLFLKENKLKQAKWWLIFRYGGDEKMADMVIKNYLQSK